MIEYYLIFLHDITYKLQHQSKTNFLNGKICLNIYYLTMFSEEVIY